MLGCPSQRNSVTLTGGDDQIPANPNRIALLITSATTNTLRIDIDSQSSAIGGGIVLATGDRPYLVHAFFHGDMPRRQHNLKGTAGETCYYIEVLIGDNKWRT